MLYYDILRQKGETMTEVKRRTAIARLRYDCTKNEEVLHMSRSIAEENEFGECYVAEARNNTVVQNGSLEAVMKDRKLLRDTETIV